MKLNKILPVSRKIKRETYPLREIRVCFRRDRAYYIPRIKLNKILSVSREIKRGQDRILEGKFEFIFEGIEHIISNE